MAPAYEMTSAQRRSIPLLDKYQCRICKKWKLKELYSKKELNDYTYKIGKGLRLNGSTADLRCRTCAGQQVAEYECHGTCGQTKPIASFSKSARGLGGSNWCKECVLWKESLESDLVPFAAPGTDLSPDEANENNNYGNSIPVYDDPEAGYDSDDDNYNYGGASVPWGPTFDTKSIAPSTGVPDRSYQNHEGIANKLSDGISKMTMSEPVRNNLKQPSSATGQYMLNMSSHPSSITSSTSTSGASFVPPHLRGLVAGSAASSSSNNIPHSGSISSMSNPFISSVQGNGSARGAWTPVDARRRAVPVPVSYNAWDNQGNQHVQQRIPSGSISDSVSLSSTVTAIATAPPVRAPSPPARKNSNWAKPVGSKNKANRWQPAPQAAAPVPATRRDDSDDESYM